MAQQPVVQTHELTKIYYYQFLGSLRFLTRSDSFKWLEPLMISARALTDLSLTIQRGEVYGLLGPNGSGKSTTIKLILGLIFPTRGQIAIFGKRPSNVDIKKRIGFLPEESYLYRFLDAEETLDFYGRLFNLSAGERKRRIDSLLDLVGLRRERRRPVVEFSKGMQRRIGIAQALINDPELVILDEPTTGLDPLGTREVKDLILQLKAKGKTVILSSHLLADVEDVCDRISILYGGRVQAEGPVGTVLRSDHNIQITADMDEDTVRQVVDLIHKRLGPDRPVDVSPPRERLEQFFLRVVHEAQTRRLQTSGVQASTGHLDFLTESDAGEGLLQQLTQSDQDKASVTEREAEAVHRVETSDPSGRATLDRLTGADEAEEKQPEPDDDTVKQDSSGDEVPPGQTDRSLLDKLTHGDE